MNKTHKQFIIILGVTLMFVGIAFAAYNETYKKDVLWIEDVYDIHGQLVNQIIHYPTYIVIRPYWQLGIAIFVCGFSTVVIGLYNNE